MSEKICRTKGDVIVNNLKIGDLTYEYGYGMEIVGEVLTEPTRDDEGYWTWRYLNVHSGVEGTYGQHVDYPHYGINLYTYPAYGGCKRI